MVHPLGYLARAAAIRRLRLPGGDGHIGSFLCMLSFALDPVHGLKAACTLQRTRPLFGSVSASMLPVVR